MNVFILLVTWMTVGQAPSSYQIDFPSRDGCAAAAEAVLKEPQRLRTLDPRWAPMVSAICVEKK